MEQEKLTELIIGCAMKVHRVLGSPNPVNLVNPVQEKNEFNGFLLDRINRIYRIV